MPIFNKCSTNYAIVNDNDTRSNFKNCFQDFQNCEMRPDSASIFNYWITIAIVVAILLIGLASLAGYFLQNRGIIFGKNAGDFIRNKVPSDPDAKLNDQMLLLKNYPSLKSDRIPKQTVSGTPEEISTQIFDDLKSMKIL